GVTLFFALAESAHAKPAEAPVERSRIVVRSIPEGATIFVDGTPIGPAEIEYAVLPGRHLIVATLAGHESAKREVEIRPGEMQVISMFLLSEETPPSSSLGFWKWTTLGIAVTAATAGIWLLAVGESARFDGAMRLPDARDNTALGAVLLGTGVATAGVSGYLFYRDGTKHPVSVGAQWLGLGLALEAAF